MTTQEAYDKMREWFSRPGGELSKITGRGGGCYYRFDKTADSPRRCAVGCLIPDDVYDPEMDDLETMPDGTSIDLMMEVFGELHDLFADANENFLCDAQQAHDTASSTAGFIGQLDEIAVSYGLTVPA